MLSAERCILHRSFADPVVLDLGAVYESLLSVEIRYLAGSEQVSPGNLSSTIRMELYLSVDQQPLATQTETVPQ